MTSLVIKCDHSIIDDFKYEVFQEDKLIYEGHVDLYSLIVNLVKGEGIYSSKIRVFNENKKQQLVIYKHIKNIINDTLFTIKSKNNSIIVREGKNFRVPDLYFRTPLGKITLWGEVKSQSYSALLKGIEIASIKGNLVRSKKEYTLIFDEEYSDLTMFFLSSVFMLDSMYHDY
ncbi:hypothetical protein SAMN00017477_2142 [Peptoniphilus asaccharolyticus DSM 20463]|uniref:Uncharacterized protein n=1 Tax=Peptoniphilus asaccharolyticus DSM 20463 TaxID=573058 RepID=A0A1W1VKD4_PEPAS|nr:hypothetical protein [Peptoniphilus asaccharolyticus]MBL7574457.1 hypothetical protein [Peptoniphilus asaccharolyticus]SMB93822.1 hypothetical protein SAMN00017477_2142 [Peptoniphilus asaccharolyticus DSM 20463]